MDKSSLAIGLVVALILSRPSLAFSADQEPLQEPIQRQPNERIYGSQLMTEQERAEYRSSIFSAKSAEEREQIRRVHHAQMKLRAEAQGLTLPDQMPARGRGMGQRACCFPSFDGGSLPAGSQLAKVDTSAQGLQSASGIPYLSGGIGEDDPMLQASESYNLHMVFAQQGSGEYVADIKVVIEDTKGKKLLDADSPGPVFYAKLPSGSYRVTVGYHGKTLSKLVTVKDRSRRDLYFHWPNDEIATNKRGK